MAVIMQRESTEYLYIGVTGDQPAVDQEVAFLIAGNRPTEPDWEAGILVDDQHTLFADASAVANGDYFIAILIGTYGGGTISLAPGDYTVWIRLSDTTEQPVRIAPVTLEIQ